MHNALDCVNKIKDRFDLASFMRELLVDYSTNKESWENDNLERYLDAITASIEDMEGYYKNRGEKMPEAPEWKTIAEILISAKYYE